MSGDFYFESVSGVQLHAYRWEPEGTPKAIVQIIHGIAEHVARYDHFARYLNEQGYLVVAEDHMGHGKSICDEVPQGYFKGGWDAAVEDCYRLLTDMKAEFPDVPYILFGHSMGSFLARSILIKHPDSGIDAAVICGSAWMPGAVLQGGKLMSGLLCHGEGAKKPSETLQNVMFGGYDKRIENKRTSSDWLTRDESVVDAYEADPLCGFAPTPALANAMMNGLIYIQKAENLKKMKKDLPVYFIAGAEDPVGDYGNGVRKAAEMFTASGMKQVSVRLYPGCRHEIHNELNKGEVSQDVAKWIRENLSEEQVQYADLIGKVLLVGITYYTHDNEFIEQKQFYGEVVEVNEHIVRVRKQDGEEFSLPPDLRSTHPAAPGEYRLRSTGEVVVDPDYLATWNVNRPKPEKEEK